MTRTANPSYLPPPPINGIRDLPQEFQNWLTLVYQNILLLSIPFPAYNSKKTYPANYPVIGGDKLPYISNSAGLLGVDPTITANHTVYSGINVSTPWTQYPDAGVVFEAWMDRIYGGA